MRKKIYRADGEPQHFSWLFINSTDPGGQLSWLIDQLLEAEEAGDKVHLIGHIPPGLPDCIETWSAMFHKIIERFSETVTGQFYGHTHYDEFSVFYKSEERTEPFGVAYIGPSATTYAYLNPAYRIYDLDADTKAVSSHETYSMNLTEANESGEPSWRLEYRSGDLGISGADPAEWDALVRRMAWDDELFDRVQGTYTPVIFLCCGHTCDHELRRTEDTTDRLLFHVSDKEKSSWPLGIESCGQAPAWNPFAQLFAQPSALSTTEPAAESA
ncbi:hypothetical protein HPB47_008438 [Ixodes persulcatus]|uniref:Uncharacterized protein n=1 Tax=Ixodes persulcatus TaxID=34615 RepID=A0AC60P556_IXOPE|nr:hypothetical protein HPB47_008438 [Ixodes persulcatus]